MARRYAATPTRRHRMSRLTAFLAQGVVAATALLSFCVQAQAPAPAAPLKIVMVGQLKTQNPDADKKVQTHLQARGYTVVLQDQAAPIPSAGDADLVILSSTIAAKDLPAGYRQLAIPLVTWENDALDDLAMTGKRISTDFGNVEKDRYVWLVNAPHPMAAGLPAGVTNVYQRQGSMSWGKPGLGATTIATIYGQPDKAALFGYEKGATMDYESLAPARRVMLFLDNDSFGNLSEAGVKLFDAAIDWAAH